jgi:hypothetical protein
MNNRKLTHWRKYIANNFTLGFDGKTNWALKRQKETARLVLEAMRIKPGILIADDVGLGKTWIGVLTAIAVADSGGSVVICAPNKEICKKWGDEIESWWGYDHNRAHPDLKNKTPQPNLDYGIKGRDLERVMPYRILIISHHDYKTRTSPWKCNLLIVDEAHRGKAKDTFYDNNYANFTLLLTATPFGKDPSHIKALLRVIGCDDVEFLAPLSNLDSINEKDFQQIQQELSKWMIRHTYDDLLQSEKNLISPLPPQTIEGSLLQEGSKGIPIKDDMRKLILHVERINLIDRTVFEDNPTITLPYSPEAISQTLTNKKSNDPRIQYHLNELKKLGNIENPLLNELKKFAQLMFEHNEKFIVFCYHHTAADTVKAAIQSVWDEHSKTITTMESQENLHTILNSWYKQRQEDLLSGGYIENEHTELERTKEILKRYLVELGTAIVKKTKDISKQDYYDLFSSVHKHQHVLKKMEMKGSSASKFRTIPSMNVNEDALKLFFNYPIPPYALVLTGKDSEGIDLHRQCSTLVHFELSYRPELTLQANGRVRRINSLASKRGQSICYYYPYLQETRSEALTHEAFTRLENFGKLLGGTHLSDTESSNTATFTNKHYTGHIK